MPTPDLVRVKLLVCAFFLFSFMSFVIQNVMTVKMDLKRLQFDLLSVKPISSLITFPATQRSIDGIIIYYLLLMNVLASSNLNFFFSLKLICMAIVIYLSL